MKEKHNLKTKNRGTERVRYGEAGAGKGMNGFLI